MKLWFLPPVLTTVLLSGPSLASQFKKRPAGEGLKKYWLEKNYAELFMDISYQARIKNILDVDIDNEGRKDLGVQFFSHCRPSASVVIDKVSAEPGITRVTEAHAA
jgi:hypothetical protein